LFEELYLHQGLERSVDALMTFFVDDVGLRLEELVDRPFFTTINGFAYQRADIHIRPAVLPRLLRVEIIILRKLFRQAGVYWREQALPNYLATVNR
jgi:hypothetical protein